MICCAIVQKVKMSDLAGSNLPLVATLLLNLRKRFWRQREWIQETALTFTAGIICDTSRIKTPETGQYTY